MQRKHISTAVALAGALGMAVTGAVAAADDGPDDTGAAGAPSQRILILVPAPAQASPNDPSGATGSPGAEGGMIILVPKGQGAHRDGSTGSHDDSAGSAPEGASPDTDPAGHGMQSPSRSGTADQDAAPADNAPSGAAPSGAPPSGAAPAPDGSAGEPDASAPNADRSRVPQSGRRGAPDSGTPPASSDGASPAPKDPSSSPYGTPPTEPGNQDSLPPNQSASAGAAGAPRGRIVILVPHPRMPDHTFDGMKMI